MKKGSDMVEFKKSKWWFSLVFEMKDRCSKKHVLGYVLTIDVTKVEVLIFVEDSWNEEPDVHQVGDEREVEVSRNFNWPPSELIKEDGVLPERVYAGAIYRTEVYTELELDTFTSIFKFHALKQLAIKRAIVTYHELVGYWLKKDFHLHCEYLSITRMLWQDHKDNA
nr:hypothetical protein [Tanacetum cinerariifolium]